jgi:hypothetical protein
VGQLSFYSAEANPPARGDLAGLLCGPGLLVSFGGVTARLSVPLADAWRGRALRRALADRGVDATLYTTGEPATGGTGGLLLRTAFRRDLTALAAAWTDGTDKACPVGLVLAGAALRLWVVASGDWIDDGGYLLRLDPAAPRVHDQVTAAVTACGLPTTRHVDEDGCPGLRISGRRRLGRLAELVGGAPSAAAETHWPAVSRVRQMA